MNTSTAALPVLVPIDVSLAMMAVMRSMTAVYSVTSTSRSAQLMAALLRAADLLAMLVRLPESEVSRSSRPPRSAFRLASESTLEMRPFRSSIWLVVSAPRLTASAVVVCSVVVVCCAVVVCCVTCCEEELAVDRAGQESRLTLAPARASSRKQYSSSYSTRS